MLIRYLVMLSLVIFAGCESDSSDSESSSGDIVQYDGVYSNSGKPMAPQQSGAKVTSMDVFQDGDNLLATDNNGINFRGSISGAAADGLSPFEIRGKTSDGTDVTIIGSFSHDGTRAKMNGNWIEPTHQSTFLGYSGDVPAPASTAADAPAPAGSDAATPATAAAPSPDRSSVDYVNAPASFELNTCTFKDDGNVGNWPITTLMRSVSVSGSQITMVYDDVNWPSDDGVNGNAWLVLDRGGWEAKTFEWLKPNQEVKSVADVVHERGIRSGESVGVFVSTFARDKRRNGDERSNIYWITWP
ncbi:MAG: hypothetical protein V1929_13000 [bacterium]